VLFELNRSATGHMEKPPVELGAVFQTEWSDNPIRIIAFDSAVAMYDAWWPHTKTWGMGKLAGKFAYFRLPLAVLLAKSKYLRTERYSEEEAAVHRPDLPFAFAQYDATNWYNTAPTSIEQLEAMLPRPSPIGAVRRLNAPSIYLAPFGPKDGPKPAILVHAKDGEAFTEAEVLWHSWQLQAPHLGVRQITSGLGVYRSGIQRRTPSYYIWGSKSRLDGPIVKVA
jgi:hypothetical protein